jgi:protein required for attachment to host cells
VVVADTGTARILLASRKPAAARAGPDGGIALVEVARLENAAAHLPARALVTDRTGRVFESGGRGPRGTKTRTRHGAQSDFDPHDVLVERFARRLVHRLESDRKRGLYEELIVIAGPKFLGVLRSQLTGMLRERLTREIARDLVRAEIDQIRRTAFG